MAYAAGDKALFKPPTQDEEEIKPNRSATALSPVPNTQKRNGIGIGLGQTFLLGTFEDLGENSINMDLVYSYMASYSFDLFLDYHYSKHPFKNTRVVLQGFAPGIKAKMYQIDSFSPFLMAGLGFYRPRVTRFVQDYGYIESKSKTTFGIHIGFGGDLRLNNLMSIGILGQFHNPFDVKQDIGPKVDGRYFKLLITLMVHF